MRSRMPRGCAARMQLALHGLKSASAGQRWCLSHRKQRFARHRCDTTRRSRQMLTPRLLRGIADFPQQRPVCPGPLGQAESTQRSPHCHADAPLSPSLRGPAEVYSASHRDGILRCALFHIKSYQDAREWKPTCRPRPCSKTCLHRMPGWIPAIPRPTAYNTIVARIIFDPWQH